MASWNDMTPQEKLQYFRDYYLLKVVIALCVLAGVIILIRDITAPEPVYALQTGIYDTSLDDTEKHRLEREMQDVLDTTEDILIDDTYTSLNNDDLMRIVSLSEAGKLDVIIAPRKVLEFLAGYGYFKDLSAECSAEFLAENRDRLLMCRGLAVSEDGLLAENAEGSGEPYAAGIDISGTLFEPYLHGMENPAAGVIYESEKLPLFEALSARTE